MTSKRNPPLGSWKSEGSANSSARCLDRTCERCVPLPSTLRVHRAFQAVIFHPDTRNSPRLGEESQDGGAPFKRKVPRSEVLERPPFNSLYPCSESVTDVSFALRKQAWFWSLTNVDVSCREYC